ncbi:uncharacterized protein LOC115888522 [Sitophilus oryzae]|uniref:Uncharacterized protein LOC115888522 n=1 Tax=Sitophilus oryzae TaxID=7048 RepID=A0A6J2YMS1_SITOR|nr:uncharacterized protein LOC115888522 [Sitophilus oryzae]
MPQVYVEKYNRFVDAVLNRINRVLGKGYDPVRVKLLSQSQRENMKNKFGKSASENTEIRSDVSNKMAELDIARSEHKKLQRSRQNSEESEFVLISKAGGSTESTSNSKGVKEVRATPFVRQNNKKKGSSSSNKKGSNKKKTSNKTKQSQSKQKARATLFGLSTLKREGDVTINMTPDYTTIKTNFMLGPLILRVEREVSKG